MMHLWFDFWFLSPQDYVIYTVNELAPRTYSTQSSFPLSAEGLPVHGQLGLIALALNPKKFLGTLRLYFARNHKVSAQQIHELTDGGYIGGAEPVIFIGDSGPGKTHRLAGLAVAACRQKGRVRFATAAALINELVEAKHQLQLGRALAVWARYDLIALDEVAYVPLAEVGGEFLFQGIAERAEKAAGDRDHQSAVFGMDAGGSQYRGYAKALLDRITDRAHIIETGTECYRFRRTLEKRKGQSSKTNSTTPPPPLTAGGRKKGM
jgi:hypothetical protein